VQQHPAFIKTELSELLILSFKITAILRRAPQIILDVPFLKLEQSRFYQRQGSTIIEVQYKLLKAGHFKIRPILIVEGVEIASEEVEVQVLPPSLTHEAQFRLRWFDAEGKKLITVSEIEKRKEEQKGQVQALMKGEKYLLIVEGFFKSEDMEEVSVKPCENSNRKNESLVETVFFIERIAEEQFVSYKKNIADISDDENAISDLSSEMLQDSDDGWQSLAAFYVYPLKSGKLENLEWDIYVKKKDGKYYSFNVKDFSAITVLKKDVRAKAENNESVFQREFRQEMKEHLENNKREEKRREKGLEISRKIRMLREQESEKWFCAEAREMRRTLEENLGVVSFEPFNYKWFVLQIALSLLFFFLSLTLSFVHYIKHRTLTKTIIKGRMFTPVNLILLIVGLSLFFFTFMVADFAREYTHVGNSMLELHSFPSKQASHLADVKVGETVRILKRHKTWRFVEKADGKKGWMK